MKKILKLVIIGIMALIMCVMIYGYFNPNKTFEQVYKFGGDYEKIALDNTRIYVPPSIEINAKESLKKLERTRQFATKLFNFEYEDVPSMSMFVVVPGNRGFERVQNYSGIYLPDQGVILLNGESALFGTTTHEYGHFLFDLYLKDRKIDIKQLPDWLVEGLAEYMKFHIEHVLPVTVYVYDAMSLEQLSVMDYGNTRTIYLQGFYMVYDLIENYGEDFIVQLMDTYTNTKDFATAFEKVTNESYDDYHKKFRINPNKITELEEKDAQDVLQSGEELFKDKASINPYTPLVLPSLVSSSLQLGKVELAKDYFNQLNRLLFNPYDYLVMAQFFFAAREDAFAEEIIEKGLQVAHQGEFDIEDFENEAQKIKETKRP